MYFQKRYGRYSFIYYDSTLKKNVRLSTDQVPSIITDEEARAFCKHWDAKHDAAKARIEKKLAWMEKYQDFTQLIQIYERSRKEEAPNSWEDCLTNIKYYVLPFFLELKQENNLNQWYWHFEDFRDYLQTAIPIKNKNKGQSLAYSSKNNIINALNTFMTTMFRRHLVDREFKCRKFSASKIKYRSEESVIEPDLQESIYQKLLQRSMLAADFFWVSLHTGMRINEQMGVSVSDFFAEPLDSPVIDRALRPLHLEPLGYLSLNSQPVERINPRDEDGHVPRKPLKGKKRMDPEDARLIPIFDQRTFHTLIRLWNEQQLAYEERAYGPNPEDYLLFDGLTKGMYARHLREAQNELKVDRQHTPHDTRHTYSTWLVERTGGNYTLCRMILGHSRIEITMRYVHMHARLQRSVRSQVQLSGPIPLVPQVPKLATVHELKIEGNSYNGRKPTWK